MATKVIDPHPPRPSEAELQDLSRNPERAAVHDALRQLHREQHPHLHQYVATVVSPSGLTLREAAGVMGISHQRVAQLRDRGLRQISESGRLDLSWWPVLPDLPPRPLRGQRPEKETLKRLRRMNVKAKAYRPGDRPGTALAFYRQVARLHHAGLSYSEMARLLGENERAFVRRLARWGVTQGAHSRAGLNVPVRSHQKRKEQDQ